MTIKYLKEFGFEKAGKWYLENGKPNFELRDEYTNKRCIYAFCNERQTFYIGICKENHTTLKTRMNRYKGKVGSGTNKRILDEIAELLEEGGEVYIYAWYPRGDENERYKYKDLSIDLINGLEYPLINKLKPIWNKQGWNKQGKKNMST